MGLTFSQPAPSSPKKQVEAKAKETTVAAANDSNSSHSNGIADSSDATEPSTSVFAPPIVKTDSISLAPAVNSKYKGIEDVQFMDEEKLPYVVELKPHVHTLFCERKQRVCTSVGKLQELEYITITKNPTAIASPQRRKSFSEQALFQQSLVVTTAPKGAWIRIFRDWDDTKKKYDNLEVFNATASCIKKPVLEPVAENESSEDKPADINTYDWNFNYAIIPGTEDALSYQLTVQDVGCYISYRLETEPKPSNLSEMSAREYFESESNKAEANNGSNVMSNLFGTENLENNENGNGNSSTYSESDEGKASSSKPQPDNRYLILRPLGYVLPGPPRLLDFDIEVVDLEATTARGTNPVPVGQNVDPDDDKTNSAYFPVTKPISSIIIGDRLIARGRYIGGYEGHSEYWWLRVSDKGERSEVKLITPINVADKFTDSDPRVLVISANDLNCEFKVKCRPVRDDNIKGEIFTSKPTPQVRINRVEA